MFCYCKTVKYINLKLFWSCSVCAVGREVKNISINFFTCIRWRWPMWVCGDIKEEEYTYLGLSYIKFPWKWKKTLRLTNVEGSLKILDQFYIKN